MPIYKKDDEDDDDDDTDCSNYGGYDFISCIKCFIQVTI